MRFVYSVLMHLAVPLTLLRLWLRGRTETGYRQHIAERFGGFDYPPEASAASAAAIWVHAVSVGEVRAAMPLVAALQTAYPHAPIVVSCLTPTGRAMAREVFGDGVQVCYLPYDLPWAIGDFIERWQPSMLLVMETEIWPNLLAKCAARNIPAFLVSARLSEKSRRGYARFAPVRWLMRQSLRRFRVVMAQSEADADRFASLGATNVVVAGNVKFDMTIDAAMAARGDAWRKIFTPVGAARPIVLLASTREGEEQALIDAFYETFWAKAEQHMIARPLLVVVPRHLGRFDEVFARIEQTGLYAARRSQGKAPSQAIDIWLGDSMGELQAYYAMCDIAIIGGSFAPLGGQNLIEAAAFAKPIIMGPSTFNFAEAVELATASNAMISVADAKAAMTEAARLLDQPVRLNRIGENARQFAAAHRGATQRCMELIRQAVAK